MPDINLSNFEIVNCDVYSFQMNKFIVSIEHFEKEFLKIFLYILVPFYTKFLSLTESVKVLNN